MPLKLPKGYSGITCSDILTEHLTAFRWRIPLDTWYTMKREERAAHIATAVADSAIREHAMKDD